VTEYIPAKFFKAPYQKHGIDHVENYGPARQYPLYGFAALESKKSDR